MNYKTIFYILLILTIITTISVCITKPKMHTVLMIYNSDYKIVEEPEKSIDIQTIPTLEQKTTPQITTTETIKNQNKTEQVKKQEINQEIKPQTVKTEKKVQPKTNQITTKKDIKTVENKSQKTITKTEEEIAWNTWRSNLQNQIMNDVKLPPIPYGTIFKFSFNVDKYGRITNVQTRAIPSNYTPQAIQFIAPVIRSYQGQSILNFPQGSNRISTEVNGYFKISIQSTYSTPQDYNDTEKISR